MSNPFAIFRKNKNYWMAGLVLLAILAFVVAPAIDQASQALRGSGAENAVVVRWNGGKMTVADVQVNLQKHGNLVRFLSALAREVIEAGGEPKVPGFFYDPQSKQIAGLGIQVNSDEESICRTRILADKAKRIGVEFSDQAVDDFILAYCDNRISTKRLGDILRESTDARLSSFDVRELLKQELSAMVVRRTATTGFYAHVPGETYQDFLKLNRSGKVEAFPVFVEESMSKVKGMPTEGEIQAIYDRGSMLVANPNSPEPGFVRPYQANLEYIESNLQDWVAREKAKLTEEQLRAEYDRLVALEQLKIPVDSTSESTTESTSDESPSAEESSATEGAEPSADTPATDTGDSAGRLAPHRYDTPSADAPSADTKGEAPAVSTPLELSPPSPPEALQGEATQTAPGADDSANSAKSSKPVPTVTSVNASISGDEADTITPRVHMVSYLQAEANDEGLPPPVVQPPQLNPDGGDSNDASPAMRTQTFEEARDGIADSLAQAAAIEALDAALTNIFEDVMKPHYGAYRQYAAYRDADLEEDDEKMQEPKRPDLRKIAEEAGLNYGETGVVDSFKLFQTQFGSGEIRQDGSGVSGTVASAAMSPELRLFQPMQSSYFDRAMLQQGIMPEFFQYLFWKTEERPAYVPELSEVRAEVVDAWKRQQARQLAEAAASALAKKVSGTGENPWKDALNTAEQSLIIETDPFTAITRMGEYTTTSNVPKLDSVGGEFMQNVFSTEQGQVTVAPNQNKSIYYVVRVSNFSPPEEELRERFIADPIKSGPLSIAQEESNRLTQGWYENLYDELGVEWQMPLNQL